MAKHQDNEVSLGVVNGAQSQGEVIRLARARTLEEYDATVHVGINTIICDAAIEHVDDDGEVSIEVPEPDALRAAAAVMRCLMDVKLRGSEMKAMRKILGLTLEGMAKRMDDRTAPETVSRWETEAQPMGGYAEKMFRLLVCEELTEKAPAIEYSAKMIANLRVLDPWRADPEFQVPPLVLRRITMKSSGAIIRAYNDKLAA